MSILWNTVQTLKLHTVGTRFGKYWKSRALWSEDPDIPCAMSSSCVKNLKKVMRGHRKATSLVLLPVLLFFGSWFYRPLFLSYCSFPLLFFPPSFTLVLSLPFYILEFENCICNMKYTRFTASILNTFTKYLYCCRYFLQCYLLLRPYWYLSIWKNCNISWAY